MFAKFMLVEAAMIIESTIVCPMCRAARTETTPTDACQYFYECTGCGTLLRPKPTDCCVFCSYGSVPCPPIQASGGKSRCCSSEDGRLTIETPPFAHHPD